MHGHTWTYYIACGQCLSKRNLLQQDDTFGHVGNQAKVVCMYSICWVKAPQIGHEI